MSSPQLQQQWQTLVHLAKVFGLEVTVVPSSDSQSQVQDSVIESLVQQRLVARRVLSFAEADRLRYEIQAMGVTLTDLPNGETRWQRK